MEPELLIMLARSRVRDLLRDAAIRRSLVRARSTRPRPIRRGVARAIRHLGYAAVTLGDAIADAR